MSTTTVRIPSVRRSPRASVADLGPVLVSDLPPVAAVPAGLLARLKDDLLARRQARTFERAIRNAGHAERHDLYALGRRG
jgi:hypothetical protein